jgi:YD repeat-containing protein
VTDAALGVTRYAYNGLDALTQVTDPRNLATGYTVDGLGNLTAQSSPDTGNTASTYDAAGNLLTQTDGKGQVTTYAYDALNRVTLVTFHDGSKHTYIYDQGTHGIGRLTSITETSGANIVTSQTAYGYDVHGRVTSDTRTIGGVQYTTGYHYDGSGRLVGMTYPSGRTVAYTLDALGRVSQLDTTKNDQSQNVLSGVAYQPFGAVKSFTFGNGQLYSRNYDRDGRISAYAFGTAQSFQIGYDAASRIESIVDLTTPQYSNSYGYDELDRLTRALGAAADFAYTYDPVGNRTSKSAGSQTDIYTYSAASNRLSAIAPAAAPPRSFVYDANGSTTAEGSNSYTYDVRGRMVSALGPVGTVDFQVNALGQRVRKTSALGDTVFHYDTRGRLIAETDPAGALKREIFYLGDIPVAVFQ